jgi:hypothetical protein
MRHTTADTAVPADMEWERAPGETRRLPWLFAGEEPAPAQAAPIRGRVARLLGRRGRRPDSLSDAA